MCGSHQAVCFPSPLRPALVPTSGKEVKSRLSQESLTSQFSATVHLPSCDLRPPLGADMPPPPSLILFWITYGPAEMEGPQQHPTNYTCGGSDVAIGVALEQGGQSRGGRELMTKPLLRPLRQWPGAPFCDVWGPTTQLFTGLSLLKERCGFFFF